MWVRALEVVCVQKIISSVYGQIEFNSIRYDSIRSRFLVNVNVCVLVAQAHTNTLMCVSIRRIFLLSSFSPNNIEFIGNGNSKFNPHRQVFIQTKVSQTQILIYSAYLQIAPFSAKIQKVQFYQWNFIRMIRKAFRTFIASHSIDFLSLYLLRFFIYWHFIIKWFNANSHVIYDLLHSHTLSHHIFMITNKKDRYIFPDFIFPSRNR